MRKAVSIVLVTLLLFNALGFYGVFLGLRLKSAQDLVQRLDLNDYKETETITLKVPVSLPYTSGKDQYERVNGEVELYGEFFHLVKQKLSQDTLYIVCIKDGQSKKIIKALNDYVKTFSDKSDSGKTTGKIFQTIIKDYLPVSLAIESHPGWSKELIAQRYRTLLHRPPYVQQVVQPPEVA